jgi:hypothetical protein
MQSHKEKCPGVSSATIRHLIIVMLMPISQAFTLFSGKDGDYRQLTTRMLYCCGGDLPAPLPQVIMDDGSGGLFSGSCGEVGEGCINRPQPQPLPARFTNFIFLQCCAQHC